jgi:DNA polymerase III delta prime subunit
MLVNVHADIMDKLLFFKRENNIPNIVFHGPYGSGKRTLVKQFITKIYGNCKDTIRMYVLYANCSHGKGIKFIREDLKFFAKTHINLNSKHNFKTIVLSNAESLTIDAQSALRRCIEQFSHNTRFFVIVNDTSKLLKPILSRFCEIYVPLPAINHRPMNLHTHHVNICFGENNEKKRTLTWIKKNIVKVDKTNYHSLLEFTDKLYEKGFSGLDLMEYIKESTLNLTSLQKTTMLVTFHKVKKDFRNEKLFILFILNFMLIRLDSVLENVSFM